MLGPPGFPMALAHDQFIRRPFTVGYRSTTAVKLVNASIKYDPRKEALVVEISSEDPRVVEIAAEDIKAVTTHDYVDDGSGAGSLFILFLAHSDGKEAFQFNRPEERDIWEQGLKRLAEGKSATAPLEEDLGFRAPVNKIGLRRPGGPEVLLSIEVVLGGNPERGLGERKACLEVLRDTATTDDLLKLIKDRVKEHEIHPDEKVPLFYYVKSVTERALLEEETKRAIDDINGQNFDVLVREREPLSRRGFLDAEALVQEAKENLAAISEQLPVRLGNKGANAEIVTGILNRNIEKMNVINDVCANAYTVAKRGHSRRGFCSC